MQLRPLSQYFSNQKVPKLNEIFSNLEDTDKNHIKRIENLINSNDQENALLALYFIMGIAPYLSGSGLEEILEIYSDQVVKIYNAGLPKNFKSIGRSDFIAQIEDGELRVKFESNKPYFFNEKIVTGAGIRLAAESFFKKPVTIQSNDIRFAKRAHFEELILTAVTNLKHVPKHTKRLRCTSIIDDLSGCPPDVEFVEVHTKKLIGAPGGCKEFHIHKYAGGFGNLPGELEKLVVHSDCNLSSLGSTPEIKHFEIHGNIALSSLSGLNTGKLEHLIIKDSNIEELDCAPVDEMKTFIINNCSLKNTDDFPGYVPVMDLTGCKNITVTEPISCGTLVIFGCDSMIQQYEEWRKARNADPKTRKLFHVDKVIYEKE